MVNIFDNAVDSKAGKLGTESAGTVTYFTLKFILYAGNWDFSIIDPVSTVQNTIGWPNYPWMPGTDHGTYCQLFVYEVPDHILAHACH
jgi:hypothetical protein